MGKCVSGEQGPYIGTGGFYVTTEYYHLLQCSMGNHRLLRFFTVKVFWSSQVTVEEENPYIFYEKHLHPSIHSFIIPASAQRISAFITQTRCVHGEEATTLSQGRPQALLHHKEKYPGTRYLWGNSRFPLHKPELQFSSVLAFFS